MKLLLVCTFLLATVVLALGTEEKHYARRIHVHFEMEHKLENIHDHLEPLKKVIHEHMAVRLFLKKEHIQNIKLTLKGTTIVIVEFETHHDGKIDVMRALTVFRENIRHHRCGIKYNGHKMEPRYESFRMHEMHGKPEEHHGGWRGLWEHCKSRKMYMYGGGLILILIIIIVVSVTAICVCVRKRRAACAKSRCNFKKNLTMGPNPYVIMDDEKEEKKVALA